MNGQAQIPLIHDPNPALVQVQQNVNKVFLSQASQVTKQSALLGQLDIVGEVKSAPALTTAQFQAQAGTDWLPCDGIMSCVNTDYSKLTGNNVVPNISGSFIRVNHA